MQCKSMSHAFYIAGSLLYMLLHAHRVQSFPFAHSPSTPNVYDAVAVLFICCFRGGTTLCFAPIFFFFSFLFASEQTSRDFAVVPLGSYFIHKQAAVRSRHGKSCFVFDVLHASQLLPLDSRLPRLLAAGTASVVVLFIIPVNTQRSQQHTLFPIMQVWQPVLWYAEGVALCHGIQVS